MIGCASLPAAAGFGRRATMKTAIKTDILQICRLLLQAVARGEHRLVLDPEGARRLTEAAIDNGDFAGDYTAERIRQSFPIAYDAALSIAYAMRADGDAPDSLRASGGHCGDRGCCGPEPVWGFSDVGGNRVPTTLIYPPPPNETVLEVVVGAHTPESIPVYLGRDNVERCSIVSAPDPSRTEAYLVACLAHDPPGSRHESFYIQGEDLRFSGRYVLWMRRNGQSRNELPPRLVAVGWMDRIRLFPVVGLRRDDLYEAAAATCLIHAFFRRRPREDYAEGDEGQLYMRARPRMPFDLRRAALDGLDRKPLRFPEIGEA
jgi:hypothetical protein